MTGLGHTVPTTSRVTMDTGQVTTRGLGRSWRPGQGRQDRVEVSAFRDCGNSGSRVEPAPAVAGSSTPLPTPSLCRTSTGCSSDCRGPLRSGMRLGPLWARSVAGVGPLPLLALPIRLVRLLPLQLHLRMPATRKPRCLPPAGRLGVGGSRPRGDCSAAGRDRSPQPEPLSLDSGLFSSPGAAWSRSGFDGCASPAPLGAAEDDLASASE